MNTIQSKASGVVAACSSGPRFFGWRDSDHRCLNRIGAKRGETFDEVGGLLARASDQHAAPEKRAGIEPAQVLSKSNHASNDQRCRLTPRVLTEPIQRTP